VGQASLETERVIIFTRGFAIKAARKTDETEYFDRSDLQVGQIKVSSFVLVLQLEHTCTIILPANLM